jgi:hypothetical protein
VCPARARWSGAGTLHQRGLDLLRAEAGRPDHAKGALCKARPTLQVWPGDPASANGLRNYQRTPHELASAHCEEDAKGTPTARLADRTSGDLAAKTLGRGTQSHRVAGVALTVLSTSWGLSLAVLGIAIAVSGIALQEGRSRVHRARRIVFSSSSDSWFSEQIYHGLHDGLRGQLNHEVVKLRPEQPLDRRALNPSSRLCATL